MYDVFPLDSVQFLYCRFTREFSGLSYGVDCVCIVRLGWEFGKFERWQIPYVHVH